MITAEIHASPLNPFRDISGQNALANKGRGGFANVGSRRSDFIILEPAFLAHTRVIKRNRINNLQVRVRPLLNHIDVQGDYYRVSLSKLHLRQDFKVKPITIYGTHH